MADAPGDEVSDRRRLLREWRTVAVLAVCAAVLLLVSGATRRIDNLIYDALTRIAARAPADKVLIVAIDDRSLSELGAWPWPRTLHAGIVRRLSDAGAASIAYDVLFIEPTTAQADAQLGAAIADSGRVCLPVLIETPGPDGASFRLTPPLPAIARGAAGLGHVNLLFDVDGVSRRADLEETAGGGRIGHLMRCALEVGRGTRPAQAPLPGPAGGQALARRNIVLVPFAGRAGTFPAVSAASLLRGEVPAAFVRGRRVIIGATASGLHDRHSTPLSTRNDTLSGVEFQANLLQGLIDGRTIRPAPLWAALALTLALVGAQLAALRTLSPRWNLATAALCMALAIAISSAGLLLLRTWAPPAPAALIILLLFPLWGWRRLQAASDYLLDELGRVSAESGGGVPQARGGDVVGRRMTQLRIAARQARALRAAAAEAAAQRDRMIQLLSHDLRSPQNSILALMASEEARAAPEPLVRRVSGHARRTLQLADNFVHLARAESSRLSLEPLDLCDVLDVAIDELWPVAQAAEVALVRPEAGELWVEGDRSLLGRAVLNLLDNAVKFSPRGAAVEAGVEAAELAGRPAARLWVRDHGPGVPLAQRQALFEPYARAAGVEAKGVGLGLALVAEAARRHRGLAACDETPGGGATFSMTLPLADG